MNKTAQEWAEVKAAEVTAGPFAQATNVLQMALDDIAALAASDRRVWKALGIETFAQAGFRENSEIVAGIVAALDRIFSLVSYVNIHGVGEQPEPTGIPQPMRIPPNEFYRIFQEIGKLASSALSKADDQP